LASNTFDSALASMLERGDSVYYVIDLSIEWSHKIDTWPNDSCKQDFRKIQNRKKINLILGFFLGISKYVISKRFTINLYFIYLA
jgi:hypothetical protein